MQPLPTILISGATLFVMSVFSALAWFLVNRYMPKAMPHIEKHFKKKDKDSDDKGGSA
jgi:hypothetical protein